MEEEAYRGPGLLVESAGLGRRRAIAAGDDGDERRSHLISEIMSSHVTTLHCTALYPVCNYNQNKSRDWQAVPFDLLFLLGKKKEINKPRTSSASKGGWCVYLSTTLSI